MHAVTVWSLLDRGYVWLTSRPPHRIHLLIAAIDIVLIAAILVIWAFPPRARFLIDAKSEIVSLDLPENTRLPAWGDLPISVSPPDPDHGVDPALAGCRAPTVRLPQRVQTKVTATWVIEDNALQLTLSSDGAPLGTLSCQGTPRGAAPDYLVARWPIGPTSLPTLRFFGEMTVGGQVASNDQSARLLREGALSVEAGSWPFSSGRISSKTDLILGDQVTFLAEDGKPAMVFGLVRADSDGLRVIGFADGSQAQVLRAGQERSEPLVVAPSFLSRLQSQAEWAVTLIIAALFLNFLTALTHLSDARSAREAKP